MTLRHFFMVCSPQGSIFARPSTTFCKKIRFCMEGVRLGAYANAHPPRENYISWRKSWKGVSNSRSQIEKCPQDPPSRSKKPPKSFPGLVGNPWGCPWGPLGDSLGTPREPLGTPWGSLGTPWGPLGNPLGNPWTPLGTPWGPQGSPKVSPRGPQD